MKFLKGLLIVVLILAAVITILGLIMDQEYKVERSTIIDACPGVVYNNISDFKKWDAWSPWSERDSLIKPSYEGEGGTIGHKYSWEGNPEISGTGSMTITAADDMGIEYDLSFVVPFESSSKGSMKMEEVDEGVKVTWTDMGELGFPMNVVAGLFMNFDEMIGKDFEQGLANLKEQLDGTEGYSPQFRNSDVIHFIGKQYEMNMSELSPDLYAATYGSLMGVMMSNELDFAGQPMAIYHEFDVDTRDMEVVLAIPVDSLIELQGEFTSGTIPAGRQAFASYMGPYEGIEETWNQMESYIECERPDIKYAPYEQYITDPGTEPDTSKWITHVVYPIGE